MEQKYERPYCMVLVTINSLHIAIPLRSSIKHKHVVWTNKNNKCGLDLSKAVIVKDENKYIEKASPQIRQDEFDALKGKEHFVQQKWKPISGSI